MPLQDTTFANDDSKKKGLVLLTPYDGTMVQAALDRRRSRAIVNNYKKRFCMTPHFGFWKLAEFGLSFCILAHHSVLGRVRHSVACPSSGSIATTLNMHTRNELPSGMPGVPILFSRVPIFLEEVSMGSYPFEVP